MKVSAAICLGAAIAAAALVRKYRHAEESDQPLEAAA
jgi:putative intracellular protease/amidase